LYGSQAGFLFTCILARRNGKIFSSALGLAHYSGQPNDVAAEMNTCGVAAAL
jgi:hypothetical protein